MTKRLQRKGVFFIAMDRMSQSSMDLSHDMTRSHDIRESRVVPYRTTWKVQQNVVYHDRGVVFWQTNSNAIISNVSVPADCVVKVLKRTTNEIINPKIRLSPRKVVVRCVEQVQPTSTGGPVRFCCWRNVFVKEA